MKYYFIIILSLSILFSFWKLGGNDVKEWDEAEYGTNAFEMMHNGDYVNYYYAHKEDTWNAKPPLLIWSIILCYKIFGYNAFALRFISALASVVFFIFMFKFISLYGSDFLAFIACLILLSCKAIIGFHVGRTGDTDALLVCFLMASVYYYSLYIDFAKSWAIFLCAIFLGLAFYAKGTASFILIPGLFIYTILRGRLKKTISDFRLWLALLIVILITGSWLVILLQKGNTFNRSSSFYGSKNALETLFYHDTFARLTDRHFEGESLPDRMYFVTILDTRFNIWNYFFYLSLLIGIIILIKERKKILSHIRSENRLLVLSVSLILPLALLLTFAANKHSWYIAPAAPFISIVIASGIVYLSEKDWKFKFIWIPVLLFTLCRHFVDLNSTKAEVSSFFCKNKDAFNNSSAVVIMNIPAQHYFLYLNWYAKNLIIPENSEVKNFLKGQMIFYNSDLIKKENLGDLKLIDCQGQIVLL